MRIDGPDLLRKNAALSDEVRKTLSDFDRIERELCKAAKAIKSASTFTVQYKTRLLQLCE
jgi:hypothetical protein